MSDPKIPEEEWQEKLDQQHKELRAEIAKENNGYGLSVDLFVNLQRINDEITREMESMMISPFAPRRGSGKGYQIPFYRREAKAVDEPSSAVNPEVVQYTRRYTYWGFDPDNAEALETEKTKAQAELGLLVAALVAAAAELGIDGADTPGELLARIVDRAKSKKRRRK